MKNKTAVMLLVLAVILSIGIALFMLGCSTEIQAVQGNVTDQAKAILKESGIKGGLIVHISSGNAGLTEALKVNDRYLVHRLDPKNENVERARQYITSKGKYGPISVDRLPAKRLPYTDNLVNLIVAETLGNIPMDEVMRVLAPKGVFLTRAQSGWSKKVKPQPAEMDEWNQYLHGADGNMVSTDRSIGPVKHYRWIGSPKWGRHHDTTTSMSAMVSANGRIFYILDEGPRESVQLPAENFLIARDAYSGIILWKKAIPEWQDHMFPMKSGPAYLPRRLVAVGDRVFVTLGINAPLTELNAATGEPVRIFPKTERTSEVIFSDKTLFLVIGRPEKTSKKFSPRYTYVWDSAEMARTEWAWSRQPAQIMAVNADKASVLWEKTYSVAPLSLTADSKSIYFYDGNRLVSMDRRDGRENWKSDPVKTRTIDTAYAPRVVVQDNVLLFSIGGSGAFAAGKMIALSAVNGKKLWEANQESSGHYSPEDMFVIDGKVWTGAIAMMGGKGNYVGRDLHTGEVKQDFPCDANVYFFHQRCYPSKATVNYIIPSRTGIEFVDLKKEHWTVNHYTRGGCVYGIMPSNGLVYAPQNACACYLETKLTGMNALAPALEKEPDLAAAAAENRLEKGPAYGKEIMDNASPQDWPTYRHDNSRTSYTGTQVPADVKPGWQLTLGGKLSSPVIAGNRLYVAKVDAHSVYALDAANGKVLWSYVTGGRVDSPPTIYKGRVLFGSADGYVYCLRALDGALAWRFRAAPLDRRLIAYEQVESVWPVSGTVLVQDGKIYTVAGRTVFLDGGMRLLQLKPETGEKLSETILDDKDPATGKNLHDLIQSLDMPVGLPDILSSDGKYLYMRSQQFDLAGNRKFVGVRNVTDQSGEGVHVFSPVGFLDDSQFVRSYMMYGKSVKSGWGGWEMMGKLTPSGRLIAVDGDTVYGYERKPEYFSESIVQDYMLYAARKTGDANAIAKINKPPKQPANAFDKGLFNYAGDWKLRQGLPKDEQTAVQFKWTVDKPPLSVRGIVLADKVMFISGPPHFVDEESTFWELDDAQVIANLAKQSELDKGKSGAILWAVSASNGKKLAEYRLASLPVWDGLVAANGKLYMTTLKGEVLSFSGKSN